MGDDTPLAVLSTRPKKLSDYFRQRFAQVTNPPIDPIRERLVMSLTSYLGKRSPNLKPDPLLAQTILLPGPIINDDELLFLESLSHEYRWTRISTGFSREESLENTLTRIADEASKEVKEGALIIILSDKDVNAERTAAPMLAAVGAVHHHLSNSGLRLKCSLVVETSQCWTSHQVASLIAYGAQCIVPYLAFETVRHWYWSDATQKLVNGNNDQADHGNSAKGSGSASSCDFEKYRGLSVYQAQSNYKAVLESGLLKILSKMGVSKLTSYVGSQIFEALGLGDDIVEKCFTGTNSPIGGLTFSELEREIRELHDRGFSPNVRLVDEGLFKNRRTGEYHRNNNELVKALHQAVALRDTKADEQTRSEQFQAYSELVAQQQLSSLRDLLAVKSDRRPIPLSLVESVESIVKRFCTGGMSLGALSKESHEALAIAMNRLGARSNSGEGGEDPNRYHPIKVEADGTSADFPGLSGLRSGDSAASKVRQVASARFGVTPEYLATAEQLEIKVAQGAKPGEGGQLPAHKVSEYIARLRRTEQGITLISPPPHHDIYSIEDLAQLIYDLKQVNDTAQISVKLVSEQGIGPIALGCAKAGADIVHIAGHDGGTGAAPIGSIKHAGLPWELGLSETHKFLTEHRVRNNTILRVDGGLRSGMDVVKAALMGGDEFAFGTIALIAQGCIMARVCHTNSCPTGIATQKDALRQRFHGNPDSVVEFFMFIAEEVRYLLAQLGYKSLADLRGRADLLVVRDDLRISKCDSLDLSEIKGTTTEYETTGATIERLPTRNETIYTTMGRVAIVSDTAEDTVYAINSGADAVGFGDIPGGQASLSLAVDNSSSSLNGKQESTICGLNELIVNDPAIIHAVNHHGSVIKGYQITNMDRTVGAGLSGSIARLHGDTGFSGQIVLNFEGTAGQSFGAFNANNVLLYLKGEANDYVGKGMFGGEIVVRSTMSSVELQDPVLVGNTCLYGAVGGRLLVSGLAGERFAVRNSGAHAVVEGVGDHGCEYMTGGVVVVLGPTGRNFGAGMSGGVALILDEQGAFADRVN
ncbi:MAG: glutamate synthase subunit alpha, partial [Cyanobacteria bacterium]|nr:glutamate synthase subunit alpha [Cyanobacteriota bacterium]